MAGPSLPRDANMNARMPVHSVRSILLPMPDRGEDLQVRISAPIQGQDLPILLFSHGFGSSMDGYAPLVDYWAAHGFIVIQPTHLDARRLGLAEDDPRRPLIWRIRVEDMKCILGSLEHVLQSLPGLADRADPARVAVAGHSFGGQTASMLLGARMTGPDGEGEDMSYAGIRAGVLLASGGRGGADLSELGHRITPYLNSGFAHMTTPALVVMGDADQSPLTVRGPDWFADPYVLSPGSKALLTLFGGEHMLGGISGYEVTETTDENPQRVALIQKVTLAYLRSRLLGDEAAWSSTCRTLEESASAVGRLDWKEN